MRLFRIVLELGNYINTFSLNKGVKIYYNIKARKSRKISISLNNITHPFNIRSQTSDIYIFPQIFLEREYDFPLGFEPKVIIDAGANIGLSAIFFTNKYPKAKIISIEPEASNFLLLQENTENYNNIIPINKAISNISNQVLHVVNNGYGNSGFMTESIEKSSNEDSKPLIETITIDEIMNKYEYEFIDILKIDIEGYEKELFETNIENWIKNTRCIIIELHDRMKHGCSKSFFSAISKYDFSFMSQGENLIFINNKKLHTIKNKKNDMQLK
jgi:FkbM family methyltransferase